MTETPPLHYEILTEEPSAKVFLETLLARKTIIRGIDSYKISSFEGKTELLKILPDKLRAYWERIPLLQAQGFELCIIVLIDKDNDDCKVLKDKLEQIARNVNLSTPSSRSNGIFRVLFRIAIGELENWYFGDETAVCNAFPRVKSFANKEKYRDPDAIPDGWEAFEDLLKQAHELKPKEKLKKSETAEKIAAYFNPQDNRSPSFQVFYKGFEDFRLIY